MAGIHRLIVLWCYSICAPKEFMPVDGNGRGVRGFDRPQGEPFF
jgi:hypothetical protein